MRREGRPAPGDMIYIEFEPGEIKTLESLDVGLAAADPGPSGELLVGLGWETWILLLARFAVETREAKPARQVEIASVAGHICAVLDSLVPDLAADLQAVLDGLAAAGSESDGGTDDEPSTRIISMNTHLRLDQLSDAAFLHRTRTLMSAIAEAGEVKATVAKNLNRAFVRQMAEAMGIRARLVEGDWQKHPVKEQDIFAIHIPRIVAEMAGFVRRTKGAFRVTKKGRALLDEAHAGQLYAELFATHFNKLNLACLDYRPEQLFPQEIVAPVLCEVVRNLTEWRSPEEIARQALPPYVFNSAPEPWGSALHWVVEARLLEPLCEFGLAEARIVSPEGEWPQSREYRKTPLFDEFLGFSEA